MINDKKQIKNFFDVQFYPKKQGIIKFYDNKKYKNKFITKKTKIASLGSCFARNIAWWLKNNEYNYLKKEEMTDKNKKRLLSANWETTYNTSSIKQIFQYSFKEFNPITKWWELDGEMKDPYRKHIKYKRGTQNKNFEQHRKSSFQALSESEVIILTLGLIEIWKDKRDGSVFWGVPPISVYDKEIYEFHVMSVEECVNDLTYIKNTIDKYNPKCKLILSVSPVPLLATFRTDVDVIMANCESKSTLRKSVGEFLKNNKNVYYFPSFEYLVFGEENPYKGDYRHVTTENINKMMKLFEKMFVKEK